MFKECVQINEVVTTVGMSKKAQSSHLDDFKAAHVQRSTFMEVIQIYCINLEIRCFTSAVSRYCHFKMHHNGRVARRAAENSYSICTLLLLLQGNICTKLLKNWKKQAAASIAASDSRTAPIEAALEYKVSLILLPSTLARDDEDMWLSVVM